MDEKHRSLLRRQRPYLVENLHNMDVLCDNLLKCDILSQGMIDEILVERTIRAKARELLTLLPRRGPKAFEMFICGLKECDMEHIAEGLVKQLNESQSVVPPTGGQIHLPTNQRCHPTSNPLPPLAFPVQVTEPHHPVCMETEASDSQDGGYQKCPSSEEMLLCIEQFSKLEYHGEMDSCVLAISTHGNNKDVVYGSDSEPVSLIDIYRLFDNGRCENLRGKPKLFLIQACRGMTSPAKSNLHPQCSIDNTPCLDGSFECVNQATHDKADRIIARATTEGDPAHRNINNGSWFIQAVVQVLENDSLKEDVSHMLTKVNRIVAEWNTTAGSHNDDSLSSQISEFTVTLTRKWYLNPPCPGL